jgi:DNA helicase-2/ATP-dependent DNA helicase PcrA
MIKLNDEQRDAVEATGNIVVTACPGSGKTRVLTARVVKAIDELGTRQGRVIALTYTNRAADEIVARLDEENIETERLWSGTIHAFALEWILRPYTPYCAELRHGFTVVNEYLAGQLLNGLKRAAGMSFFDSVSTARRRDATDCNDNAVSKGVFRAYKAELRRLQVIDFDDVLYLAYQLLQDRPEIAATVGAITPVICVDEVQDIQDLQYAILSSIFKAADAKPTLFFVGDEHQSIYESLGAMTKTPEEIAVEFNLPEIRHLELHGNYRSSQRIIDLYRQFRPTVGTIQGLSVAAAERGQITFDNQTISKDQLAGAIAGRISAALRGGTPAQDICVIAPQWVHIKPLARQLVGLLPEVEFDAPGLSPLHSSYENFWFKIARLALTRPSPKRTRTRMRWAGEAIAELRHIVAFDPPENICTARRLLRLLNSLSSDETDGLKFLADVFKQFLRHIALDVETCVALQQAYEGFFERAEAHFANVEEALPRDIGSFRRLFNHPSGVVINSCHGVKGEEYDTVIAFGLLRGYIPHWNVIYNRTADVARDQESKLLYVICSRAKKRLHLIAESGRKTRGGVRLDTADLIRALRYVFD